MPERQQRCEVHVRVGQPLVTSRPPLHHPRTHFVYPPVKLHNCAAFMRKYLPGPLLVVTMVLQSRITLPPGSQLPAALAIMAHGNLAHEEAKED